MLLIYIMRFSLYFVHYLHFPQEHVVWIEMLVEVQYEGLPWIVIGIFISEIFQLLECSLFMIKLEVQYIVHVEQYTTIL